MSSLLYTQLRTDDKGNQQYNPITNEQTKIINNMVLLNELPYEFARVVVTPPDDSIMVEIDIRQPITNANQYKVNYYNPNATVYFHPDREGQTMIFNYTGMGLIYIDGSRVVTLYENGTIKETLNSLAETMRQTNLDMIANEQQRINDFTQMQTDYRNATHTNIITWAEWTFTATTDNTTEYDLNVPQYNPLIDDARLLYEGMELERDVNYTLVGTHITLGWALNNGEQIVHRIIKGVNYTPQPADASLYPAHSMPKEVLALDAYNAIQSVGNKDNLLTNDKTSLVNAINENVTQLADNVSMSKYAENIKRDSFFNSDALTGTSGAYWGRNGIIIPDSHGWGEGSPNYQGTSAGYSIHVPWIHNDGYAGRLLKYIMTKFNSEPWRCVPIIDRDNLPTGTVATNPVKTADGKMVSKVFKDIFTCTPRFLKGRYRIYQHTVGGGFNGALSRIDTYAQTNYLYNAEIGLFNDSIFELAPDSTTGDSCVIFDLQTPTRFVVLHLTGSTVWGAKAKIELLSDYDSEQDATEKLYATTARFGSSYYGTAVPSVYDGNLSTSYADASIQSSYIEIDTSKFTGDKYFIIDFKQKKKGKVRLHHNGNGVSATGVATAYNSTAIVSKGILCNNLEAVKNWGMGGHTVGAWLGLEASYWNETRNHVADAITFFPSNLKFAFIQAPIVNEHIKQTSIANLKSRLDTLKSTLNVGSMIMFTTIGERNAEFISDTATITYDMYFQAVKEWAEANVDTVTFVDCRKYLKGLVSAGVVSYTDLYINNGHPSPMANEYIFRMLRDISDFKL